MPGRLPTFTTPSARSGEMAVGYECPECKTCWPHYRSFASCPECRIACRSAVTPRVLTAAQAKSRLLHIEFIKYYEAREKFRSGPSPEELGRREGREQAERIRQMKLQMKDPGD